MSKTSNAPRLVVKRVPITSIKPDPENARNHPAKNLAAIKASMTKYGQQKPLVVKNGVVVAGSGFLEAAIGLGWTHIDVVETELDGQDVRGYAIADNRTGELSEWNLEQLSKDLDSLKVSGFDIGSIGFDERELGKLLGKAPEAGNTDPDFVPSAPAKASTQHGDVWTLGNHRLMCGDSSSASDVDRLLGGQKIDLVNTDPPYNVKVEPRSNNAIAAGLSSFPVAQARQDGGMKHHQAFDLARRPGIAKATHSQLRAKDRPLANDFVSDADFDRMLKAWFGNMARVLNPGRSFYIWGGYANCANYPPVLKASELYFSQAIIWVKEHPVLTRKDFMGNHEWCFYGWREGAAHKFYGPANVPDVWSIKKVNPQSMIHLTEKPVELAVRAIQYSTLEGQNVLDLFGGSGSTLIAAEQTNRHAFLMELDQLYCDVIVERWENFTGRKASRQNATGANVGGEPFSGGTKTHRARKNPAKTTG